MKLTTFTIACVAFLAGQGWAWVYTEGPLVAPAMAAAPQCVTVEQAQFGKPDIHEILAAMPANIRHSVASGNLPPPAPRAKPDAIGQMIGGL
jgi:hypothetical protein